MGLFDSAGKGAAEEIHKTATDALDKVWPILRNVESMAQGILHGLLDRLNGTKITLVIEIPQPKAKAANPPPEQDHVY